MKMTKYPLIKDAETSHTSHMAFEKIGICEVATRLVAPNQFTTSLRTPLGPILACNGITFSQEEAEKVHNRMCYLAKKINQMNTKLCKLTTRRIQHSVTEPETLL